MRVKGSRTIRLSQDGRDRSSSEALHARIMQRVSSATSLSLATNHTHRLCLFFARTDRLCYKPHVRTNHTFATNVYHTFTTRLLQTTRSLQTTRIICACSLHARIIQRVSSATSLSLATNHSHRLCLFTTEIKTRHTFRVQNQVWPTYAKDHSSNIHNRSHN